MRLSPIRFPMMYSSSGYKYRPNTRKIYEEHYGVRVPSHMSVHHKLPVRLGGTHDPENLEPLTKDQHVVAHIMLYAIHGDVRDLCAAHMICGHTKESRRLAASMGGKKSAENSRNLDRPMGFQFFDPEFHRQVASEAGKIGGAVCRDRKLGIHAQTAEERREIASLGGLKSCDFNGWRNSKVQSENGKKGGPKNKGFRWYVKDGKRLKYTLKMQEKESFGDFIQRTGYEVGGTPTFAKGSRYYNDGVKEYVFNPLKHDITFDQFIESGSFVAGRKKRK